MGDEVVTLNFRVISIIVVGFEVFVSCSSCQLETRGLQYSKFDSRFDTSVQKLLILRQYLLLYFNVGVGRNVKSVAVNSFNFESNLLKYIYNQNLWIFSDELISVSSLF